MANIKGDKELQKKFNKLAKQIKSNKKPMYKRIGVKLIQEIDKTFRQESHEGEKWPLLKLSTIQQRRKSKPGEPVKILRDNRRLQASFTPQHSESKYRLTDNLIRVGTNLEYAPSHEFGIGNPKRKMLPSKSRALEISVKIADGYIDEKIKQAGL